MKPHSSKPEERCKHIQKNYIGGLIDGVIFVKCLDCHKEAVCLITNKGLIAL